MELKERLLSWSAGIGTSSGEREINLERYLYLVCRSFRSAQRKFKRELKKQMQKEREDGSIRVEQVIYVQKESHKIMVLGKSGKKIKVIGKSSREELTSILGRRVHLFIFVCLVPDRVITPLIHVC